VEWSEIPGRMRAPVKNRLAGVEEPNTDDLETLGLAYAGAMARSTVVPTDGGDFELAWRETDDLERPLWPVARSAVELLTGADPHRVKACPADEGCGWLFYDESKNSSRRWCSMQGCDSRAKMRRMYARKITSREHSRR
jgi:predicted RNA-binding Zn ribbon-like protein